MEFVVAQISVYHQTWQASFLEGEVKPSDRWKPRRANSLALKADILLSECAQINVLLMNIQPWRQCPNAMPP